MRLAKFAGLATALMFAATATPAHATNVGVGVGCGYQQICDGLGQAVPIGTGSQSVAVTCHVTTPYVVQATGVGCYIQGYFLGDRHHAPTIFTQGQTSTTTAVFAGLIAQPYLLCVGGGVITSGGTARPVTNHSCFFPL